MKVHAQRHRSGNHCQFFMDLPMTLRRYIVLHASGQGEKHTAYNKRSRPSALCRATVPPSPGKNLLPSKAENQANNPAFKAPVSTESGDHVPGVESPCITMHYQFTMHQCIIMHVLTSIYGTTFFHALHVLIQDKWFWIVINTIHTYDKTLTEDS